MRGIIVFLCVFGSIFTLAQKKPFVLVDVHTKERFVRKDSVLAVKFLDSLTQNNYFFTSLKKVEEQENQTMIYFDKGQNFNKVWVKISDTIVQDLKFKKEFFTNNLDSLKQKIHQFYVQRGYAFSRVQSQYKGRKGNELLVGLKVFHQDKRTISGFVFKGYDKIPSRYRKNLEKEYLGKVYDDKILLSINKQLSGNPYLNLEKTPQTLFTKDSTQIYLFTQKRKANTFDGVLGFGTNEKQKFALNGMLDVSLKNLFNRFEHIGLYWQRNPNSGQTFDLHTDIPYWFKSNLGFKANINIYRQDSTFANVKIAPSVYYQLSLRQKVGVRGQVELSSVLQEKSLLKDYTRKGVGIWYENRQPTEIPLFIHQSYVRAEADFLKNNDEHSTATNQYKYFIIGEKNLPLSGNHYLNLKVESASLITEEPLPENEVLRFGGWNSFRGVNENSLVADFYAFGGVEYRYVMDSQAFFDVFVQYAQLQNKALQVSPKFYSIGLGFHLQLPIGGMNFQISNGSQLGEEFNFRNTKIHWGMISRF